MIQHKSPISGISVFGDTLIATSGYDNQVILWDAKTHEPRQRVWHDHLVNQCAFSPCGKYLATASSDHTARLWSLPTLKLLTVFDGHTDDVEMIVFHPTRELAATACRDSQIRVFNFAGRLVTTLVGHSADVNSVAWAATGDELVSSSDDGTVRRWNGVTGEAVETVDMGGVQVDTVAFDPEGVIFAGNDAGEILVIEKHFRLTRRYHSAGIKRLVYDPVTQRLVSTSYDRSVKVFDFKEGALQEALTTELPAEVWPRSCAFLGKRSLVFGTFGSQYALLDTHTGKWDLSLLSPTWGMNAVCADNESVFSVGDAGIVLKNGARYRDLGSLCNFLLPFEDSLLTGGQMGLVFDAVSGETLYRHRSPLNCGATFELNGRRRAILGTYTGEGLIFGWSASGRPVFEGSVLLHRNAIKGIVEIGGRFASACSTGEIAFHQIQESSAGIVAVQESLSQAHTNVANGCAAVGETVVATVARDRKIVFWDAASQKRVLAIDTPHTHSIKCIAVSPDGEFVATGAYNGAIAIYQYSSRKWVHREKPTPCGISSLCATENGFLASSYDGNIYPIDFSQSLVSQAIGRAS